MWLRSRCTLAHLKAATKFSRSPCLAYSYSYSDISSDISHKKTKMAPLQERRMIDRFRLFAKGGEGGNGCSSFRRSRQDRRGKPDGGNGGRGGDVILVCSPSVWDFSSLLHHVNAKRGGHGAPKNMIGSRGADKVVHVPVGTVIHLLEGEIPSSVEKKSSGPLDPWDIPGTLDIESSQQSPTPETDNLEKTEIVRKGFPPSKETLKKPVLETTPLSSPSRDKSKNGFSQKAQGYSEWEDFNDETNSHDEDFSEPDETQYDFAELTEPGQQIIVARGGEGGLGNIHFSKNSKKDPDSDSDLPINLGSLGSEVNLLLELKSLADVGLVGMPNAGKSTLLGAISRAKPTIGHYAFTTLRPSLGNLNYDDISITVADIPGLIKGAHENRGLGHAFLRHIERTKVLAYVVDLGAGVEGRKGIPPWEQLRDLVMELEMYSEGLSSRPSLIVANKIDESGAEEQYEELVRRVGGCGVDIFKVCAVLGEGVVELKEGLKKMVDGGGGEEVGRLKIDEMILD